MDQNFDYEAWLEQNLWKYYDWKSFEFRSRFLSFVFKLLFFSFSQINVKHLPQCKYRINLRDSQFIYTWLINAAINIINPSLT